MQLRALVVADPDRSVATAVAGQCRRLAAAVATATDGAATLAEAQRLRPELVVLALELADPSPEVLVPALREAVPHVLVVATFRTLSMSLMERLGRLGISHFVCHPIDATAIFRAAAQRFQTPHRLLSRFTVSLEVRRCGSAEVGRTIDLSEGGMRLVLPGAVTPGSVVPLELLLPDGQPRPIKVRWRVIDVDATAPDAAVGRGTFEGLHGPEQERLLAFLDRLEAAAGTAPAADPDADDA